MWFNWDLTIYERTRGWNKDNNCVLITLLLTSPIGLMPSLCEVVLSPGAGGKLEFTDRDHLYYKKIPSDWIMVTVTTGSESGLPETVQRTSATAPAAVIGAVAAADAGGSVFSRSVFCVSTARLTCQYRLAHLTSCAVYTSCRPASIVASRKRHGGIEQLQQSRPRSDK